jgi:two-component system CheB/CheR fusion protein
MMKKSVEILGLPVISISEGCELGTAKVLVIDPTQGAVSAIAVEDGKWYLARIVPYKTYENIIAGAVLTFVDIDQQRKARILTQHALDYVEGILETVREPLLVLDDETRVISANKSFYDKFKVTEKDTRGKLLYTLGNNQWNIPELKELLEKVISKDQVFENSRVEHEFPRIGYKKMLLNARKIYQKGIEMEMTLLAIEDITKIK